MFSVKIGHFILSGEMSNSTFSIHPNVDQNVPQSHLLLSLRLHLELLLREAEDALQGPRVE